MFFYTLRFIYGDVRHKLKKMKTRIIFLKSIITIFLLIITTGCNKKKSKVCAKSSNEAFELFKLNVQNKDSINVDELFAYDKTEISEIYIDTIFKILNKPSLKFIPETNDGAFGSKEFASHDLFFAYLKEDGKIFSPIGIMFRQYGNCNQIFNIVKVSISKENISNEEYFDKSKLSKSKITKNAIPIKPRIIETEPSIEEQKSYDLAHGLWYNDKPNQAIELFKDFIKKYPKSSLADDAQRMIGNSYGNLEDYEKSIIEYKKVKINYPQSNSSSISLYDMAHLYFYSLNDFEEAKYYYNEFINSATEENIKWRDIAIEQLKKWDEKVKRYSGYAERRKLDKKRQNLVVEKNEIIEKLKEKARRDWPDDYTTQAYWINEQIEAYEYMLNVDDASIKRKAQMDWPLDFTTQKYWYNQQIEAKKRLE